MTLVYGYYRTAADEPETGSVTITPYLTVPHDDPQVRLVTEKKVVARLDADGYMEMEVIPSDDPGWRTGGESVPYLVEERLEGEIRERLVFVLGSVPVDINLLPNEPVDTQGPVETPVPGIQGPPGPPGGVVLSGWWSYNDLETEPPLPGQVRTTPATVAVDEQFTMFLHHTDDDGLDWSGTTVLADDRFLLRSETGESWYTTVVSSVVNADYTAFTLSLDTSSAQAPKKNTRVQVSLERSQPMVPEYLDDLADVDMTTAAPTDGQAVVWSEAGQKFVPGGVTEAPADGTGYVRKNGAWAAESGGGGGGGIPEAPVDGKQYARQDAAWSEVVAGGGGGASALGDLTDVDTFGASNGEALVYTEGGGTEYAYQGVPANDGIIAALGGKAAHPGTLLASQSSTNAGLVAENALSPDTSTATGRSHTQSEAQPWWMIEFQGGAVADVTGLALRSQDFRDGFAELPILEGRTPGTTTGWVPIGQVTANPGENNWTPLMAPAQPVRCDAIRARVTGSGFLIIGSIEMWGTWYPSGVQNSWTPQPSLPDAPADGKQYARKDSAWSEVAATGAPVLVLGASDPVPPGTEAGTVIVRTA